jgi:hypothetical protein
MSRRRGSGSPCLSGHVCALKDASGLSRGRRGRRAVTSAARELCPARCSLLAKNIGYLNILGPKCRVIVFLAVPEASQCRFGACAARQGVSCAKDGGASSSDSGKNLPRVWARSDGTGGNRYCLADPSRGEEPASQDQAPVSSVRRMVRRPGWFAARSLPGRLGHVRAAVGAAGRRPVPARTTAGSRPESFMSRQRGPA